MLVVLPLRLALRVALRIALRVALRIALRVALRCVHVFFVFHVQRLWLVVLAVAPKRGRRVVVVVSCCCPSFFAHVSVFLYLFRFPRVYSPTWDSCCFVNLSDNMAQYGIGLSLQQFPPERKETLQNYRYTFALNKIRKLALLRCRTLNLKIQTSPAYGLASVHIQRAQTCKNMVLRQKLLNLPLKSFLLLFGEICC